MSKKRIHAVEAFSMQRYRGPGGTTETRFLIEDPENPGEHIYTGKGKQPMLRRTHALRQHAKKFGITLPIKHVKNAKLKARSKAAGEKKRANPVTNRPKPNPGGSVVQQRNAIKREILERRRNVIPQLKQTLKAAQANRRTKIRECKADCRAALRRVRKRATEARKKLEQHIRKAKTKAQAVCSSCKVVDRKGVESISQALAALDKERSEINKLRTQASYLKSERGRAGGRKAAELRSESDSAVIHNLEGDQDLIALFKKVRGKIKPSKYQSRTEAFLQYVHDNPQALAELRAKNEEKYAREAERLFRERQPDANGNSCWSDLTKCQRELDELKAAERFLSEVEKDVPF